MQITMAEQGFPSLLFNVSMGVDIILRSAATSAQSFSAFKSISIVYSRPNIVKIDFSEASCLESPKQSQRAWEHEMILWGKLEVTSALHARKSSGTEHGMIGCGAGKHVDDDSIVCFIQKLPCLLDLMRISFVLQ